nr:HAMP domain-containing histidine kinase [Bdellovibrionales bacterium]
MKKLIRNPLFPLENLPVVWRFTLALLPMLIAFGCMPFLPKIMMQTPGVFFFPVFFLATWLGGIWPGFISSLACLLYAGTIIRPQLTINPFVDVLFLNRSLIFLFPCILVLALVGALQRALKKANHAIALRDEFLDLASHELKTPLTVLMLNLETAKRVLSEQV